MSTYKDNAEAGRAIAEEGGPEAVGMVVGILAHNAEQSANLWDSLVEGERASTERWKSRALEAEAMLAKIEDRFHRLLFAEWSPLDSRPLP